MRRAWRLAPDIPSLPGVKNPVVSRGAGRGVFWALRGIGATRKCGQMRAGWNRPGGAVQKALSGDRRDRPLCLSETLTKDNHGGQDNPDEGLSLRGH